MKAEDCEDERQKYYWEKIKAPYVYAKGYHKEGGSHIEDDEDGEWVTLIGGSPPGTTPDLPDPCPPGAICIDNPIEHDSFSELIEALINFIFWLAIVIAPIMFIIAGFAFITAGGDPSKVKRAMDIVLWTAVGLIVVMLAHGIINVIQDIFG